MPSSRILILLFLFLFPFFAFASWLSKQDACSRLDGIHREQVYILWPGKFVQVDEYLKHEGFLYYFIHVFPDQVTLDAYRKNGNNPEIPGAILRNDGSYLASYDCSRSKVKFYPQVRSFGGTAFGKLNWVLGNYLSYSLVGYDRNTCTTGPDDLLDMTRIARMRLDQMIALPKSSSTLCVGRSMYRALEDGRIQFDIEEYHTDTEESFYSRYQYQFTTKKLKKIG